MEISAQLFTGLRGSAADKTASRNAHGQYVYDRVTPYDPNSIRQQGVRNTIRQHSGDWRDFLTPADRDGWNLYAAHTPVGNHLKSKKYLTGYQHYMRRLIVTHRAGLNPVFTPPVPWGLPPFKPLGFKIVNGFNVISVTWDNSDDWASELGSWAFISATVGYSRFIWSFKPPVAYKGKVPGSASPPTTVPLGYTAQALDHTFVRSRIIRADGRLSRLRTAMVVVAF